LFILQHFSSNPAKLLFFSFASSLVEPHADAGSDQRLDHFSSLPVGSLSEIKPRRLKDYADVIFGFLAEFDRCFKNFNNLKPQFALFAAPFDVDAESVSEEFQMEVLDLKCDKQKQKYTDMGVSDFYNFFQEKEYLKLVSAASEIA